MKITVEKPEFSLFMLFVHDHEHECWPFSPQCVEEAINERLEQLGTGSPMHWYEVAYPDMGRSWKVKGLGISKRLYSIEQVKEAFPDELVKQLEQIEKEGLTLKR